MQLHRTSSSRKARRKNEREGVTRPQNALTDDDSSLNDGHGGGGGWRVNVKLWLLEQLTNATTLSLAIGIAFIYFCNTASLFETITKFSHFTNAERELLLPTDVAFRYGFFKKIALAETYMDGLRRVTTDEKNFNGETTVNSFQRHSLGPEAVLGGIFHLLKIFSQSTGWPKTECRGEKLLLTCSRLGDPLTFYVKSVWTLESFVVVLIFYLGLRFGKSILGGIIASSLYNFLHPQRFNYDWLFPLHEKIGWLLVFCQLYCVSRTVFCRGRRGGIHHPPWSSTVKIGVCTALLILGWNKEAQWFLSSQVLIIGVLHIFDFFSRYVASLIIFGVFTGWQYASLVSMDTSFHHWSFFLYVWTATVVTIFLLEPILDWIIGRKKRDKWTFLRRTVLLVTLQLVLISVRCDLGQIFPFLEDTRFPLKIDIIEGQDETEPTWHKTASAYLSLEEEEAKANEAEDPSILDFSSSISTDDEEEEDNFINENFPFRDDSMVTTAEEESDETNEEEAHVPERRKLSKKNVLAWQLTEFLRSCFQSQAKICVSKFLSKYFFLIFTLLYTLFVSILLPLVMSKSRKSNGENGDLIRESENSSLSKRISFSILRFPFTFNGGSHRKTEGEENEENLKWNPFLSYHIVQTGFFGLFCLSLDKRGWEIFWLSHSVLVISLLCDFQKVTRTLERCRFTYANHLHFGSVVVILGILIASSRLRSSQMYQKSRGRFEIGSPIIASLMEAHQWIELNTDKSARIAGLPDNLMVSLSLLMMGTNDMDDGGDDESKRRTVNHHLTVHSWARESGHFEFYEFFEKIPSETKSRPPSSSSPVDGGDGSGGDRSSDGIQERQRRDKVESRSKWNGMGEGGGGGGSESESVGLSSKPWKKKIGGSRGKRRMTAGTSLLTASEIQSLEKIYSLFSRWKSVRDFHEGLVSLNVTYLMLLSTEQCSTKPTSFHLSAATTTTSTSSASPTLSKTNRIVNNAASTITTSSTSKIPVATPTTTLLDSSSSSSAEIFLDSSSNFEDNVLRQNSSISGTCQWWLWQSNWQEEASYRRNHDSQHLRSSSKNFVHFSKNCDFLHFWDFVKMHNNKVRAAEVDEEEDGDGGGESVSSTKRERQNLKSHQNIKDFDSNVKGSYQLNFQPAATHHKINERRRHHHRPGTTGGGGQDEDDRKSNEAQHQRSSHVEMTEEMMEEPILCCRLLNERNVLPFQRVFQNQFFTILAT